MVVRSSTTEHHANGARRIVPLFPKLRPYLDRAFESAEDGAVHVVSRYHNNTNLRTRFHKIIQSAGLERGPSCSRICAGNQRSEPVTQHSVGAQSFAQPGQADTQRGVIDVQLLCDFRGGVTVRSSLQDMPFGFSQLLAQLCHVVSKLGHPRWVGLRRAEIGEQIR